MVDFPQTVHSFLKDTYIKEEIIDNNIHKNILNLKSFLNSPIDAFAKKSFLENISQHDIISVIHKHNLITKDFLLNFTTKKLSFA